VVRYKAAFLLYSHRHYTEAAKRFEHIILKWPDDKWANKAADLILDSLNTKERWAELNKLAREFRKNRRLVRGGGKGFATRLDTLVEGSAFKMVLALNAAKKYDEAAPKFRAFVKEFPHSKYADKALYNAMVIFARAKTLDKAVTVGEQLLKEYPKSDLKPMVVTSLGSYYEQMADYGTAARYYETYADDYLDAKGKAFKALPADMQQKVTESLPDNLFNAALWYEGLGQDDKAVANYQRYVKTFPKRDDVPEIFYNVALIYQREKDWKHEISQLQDYVKDYARRIKPSDVYRAKFKEAQAYEQLQQPKDAAKVYQDLARHYAALPKEAKQNPEVMDAAASAAFHLLEPEWKDYKAITFDTSKARVLKKRLAEKTKALAKLEKEYTQVLTYGSGDWGIAALTRIGMGYQDLAQNFLDAPTPKGLTADQQEMYKSVLQEKAFPLQDKAIEAFQKALAKSYELSVYNQWTLDAQNDLLKFKPDAYGAVHDVPYFGSEFFIQAPPEQSLRETPQVVAPPPPPEAPASPAHADSQPSGSAQSAGRS
jgi:TolA-binding protein